MKLFNLFCGLASANPMMNFFLMNEVLDGDSTDSSSSDDNLLMMMIMSPGLLGGNEAQADQMSSLLPLMLMDESSDDNNLMFMMTIMQSGPNGMASNMDQMLPFLLINEGETDMKNLFLMTTMMQNNCNDTNQQINSVLPHLLKADSEFTDSANKNLKTMLLLQIMSEGKNGLDMSTMLPFIMMDDQSEDDHLLRMVLINSILGEMDHISCPQSFMMRM